MAYMQKVPNNGANRFAWYHQNVIYKIRLRKGGKIYFTCTKPFCSGSIITDLEYRIIQADQNHSQHANDETAIAKLILIEDLRRRSKAESTPLSVIFEQEISTRPLEVTRLVTLPMMEKQMNRWRRQSYPIQPTSLDEMSMCLSLPAHEILGQSLVEGSPFYRTCINGHSLLFISETCKPALLRENTVFNIDATYKAVPNLRDARQMLTVMAPVADVALPVVYIVMRYKTVDAYCDVLQELYRLVPGMRPRAIIADFETALHRAIRRVFGENTRIIGCWFHYAQALERYQRRDRHLTNHALNANAELRNILGMAKAVPLLHADDIPRGIDYLFEVANGAPEIAPFLNYLRNYWEPKKDILSVFNEPRRTNNEIEAYHRHILRHFGGGTRGGARPHCWVFLTELQLIERSYANTYAALQSGVRGAWPQRRTYRINNEQILNAWANYEIGDNASIEHLLRWMRHRAPLAGGQGEEYEEIDIFLDWDEDPDDPDDPDEIQLEPQVRPPQNHEQIEPEPQVRPPQNHEQIEPEPQVRPPQNHERIEPEPQVRLPQNNDGVEPEPQVRAQQNNDVADGENPLNCIICLTNPRTHIIRQCGHFLLCQACCETLLQSPFVNRMCPACRTMVFDMTDFQRIYI